MYSLSKLLLGQSQSVSLSVLALQTLPLPFPSALPSCRPSHNVVPFPAAAGVAFYGNFFQPLEPLSIDLPAEADTDLNGSYIPSDGDDDAYFMIVRPEGRREQNGKRGVSVRIRAIYLGVSGPPGLHYI